MTTRRRSIPLLATLLLLVASGLVGCGDDGDDDASGDPTSTTTTEAAGDETTTEAPADDETTTEAPADDETTTTEGPTTTAPVPDDSELAGLLLDPAAVGPEFTPDDTLGDGTFDPQLCPDITLEETWDDQAAQALVAGADEEAILFQQAILRFPDDAAAEAFTAELGDALVTCQPGTEVAPVDGAGDEALLATAADTGTTAMAGVVRVGALVSWILGISGPDLAAPVDEGILTAAADALAG
ncbi:MAG TPA: hypothetical protein VF228_15400 [Iamia sp.]